MRHFVPLNFCLSLDFSLLVGSLYFHTLCSSSGKHFLLVPGISYGFPRWMENSFFFLLQIPGCWWNNISEYALWNVLLTPPSFTEPVALTGRLCFVSAFLKEMFLLGERWRLLPLWRRSPAFLSSWHWIYFIVSHFLAAKLIFLLNLI